MAIIQLSNLLSSVYFSTPVLIIIGRNSTDKCYVIHLLADYWLACLFESKPQSYCALVCTALYV